MTRLLGLGVAVWIALAGNSTAAERGGLFKKKDRKASVLKVGELEREYYLVKPAQVEAGRLLPVVLVFHGGSGNALQMEKYSGFSALVETEGFIAVYPEGLEKNWNDGRTVERSRAHTEKLDDIGFISALIDVLVKDHGADPGRVYSTGISNGAIFSHYLAAHLSEKIVAIAGCCGSLAEAEEKNFAPKKPVSILIMNGTADPLTPYDGGAIALNRGRIISTDAIVKKWVAINACTAEPVQAPALDKDPEDGTKILTTTYGGGMEGTEVVVMKIEGGGHTMPSCSQYLPEALIGKTSKEIVASAVIWEFFEKHARK